MTAKPKPRPDNPEQSARFIEAAKRAEVDETEKGFEAAFRQLIRPRTVKTGPK